MLTGNAVLYRTLRRETPPLADTLRLAYKTTLKKHVWFGCAVRLGWQRDTDNLFQPRP